MAEIWRGRPPDIEGTISNGCNLKLRVRSQCTNIWKESTDFQAFENPGCAHSAACAGEMLVQQSALHVAGSQETSVSGSQNSKPGASEVSKFLCQENQPCPMTNIFVLCSLHKGMEDIGLSSRLKYGDVGLQIL